MIHGIFKMCLNIVYFYTIDNSWDWVKHSMFATMIVAFDEDGISFQLFAVVTEVQVAIVVAILRKLFLHCLGIKIKATISMVTKSIDGIIFQYLIWA